MATEDYSIPSYVALTTNGTMPRYRLNPFESPIEDAVREIWVDFGPKGVTPEDLAPLVEWLRAHPGVQIRLSDQHRTQGFKLQLDSIQLFGFAENLRVALDTLKTVAPLTDSPYLRSLSFSATNKITDWNRLVEVPNLRALALHHLKLETLDFVSTLPKLESLRLSVMRKLTGLEFLSSCRSLVQLELDWLGWGQLQIPSLASLTHLRRLSIYPRDLEDLKVITSVPALEDLRICSPPENLEEPKVYEFLRNHPTIKRVRLKYHGPLERALWREYGLSPGGMWPDGENWQALMSVNEEKVN